MSDQPFKTSDWKALADCLRTQRDEARAEVERLKYDVEKWRNEAYAKDAEVQRLRKALVRCTSKCWDGDIGQCECCDFADKTARAALEGPTK